MVANLETEELDYVCDDALDSIWKYDGANNTYYRIYSDEKYTKINGEYLPDPHKLLDNRIDIHSKKGERVNIDALKPSDAVYALWEHQLGVIDG